MLSSIPSSIGLILYLLLYLSFKRIANNSSGALPALLPIPYKVPSTTISLFVSFSRKDVQTAAADLISGRLQSVEITYMEHALWIQCATHKDKEGCFVINAVHPDYTDTAFTAKMSSAEAFMWRTQYPCGGFLPEGEIWEKKAED